MFPPQKANEVELALDLAFGAVEFDGDFTVAIAEQAANGDEPKLLLQTEQQLLAGQVEIVRALTCPMSWSRGRLSSPTVLSRRAWPPFHAASAAGTCGR